MVPAPALDGPSAVKRGGPGAAVLLIAGLAVAGAGIALTAGNIHPIWIGAGLCAYLIALRALLFRGPPGDPARREFRAGELFEIVPCYISVQDPNFRIVTSNALFKRDFGDNAGRQCFHVYKGRDSVCPECPVAKTFKDGGSYSCEETVFKRDGRKANVIVYSSPLCDARGRVTHVLEMMTDITEVKQLHSELDKSRREYKQLFDVVPCYISVHDREYRIVESNALFKRHFGDQTGERCFKVYKGRARVCPNCPVEKSFDDGKSHSSEEILVTRDGHPAHMIVYSMPLRNEEGEIDRVLEMMTDITEVKRLQRELTTTGKAVAGMAHRIKNILMGLEGGIFVVNTGMETSDDDTVKQGWEMIERNVGKVSHIVKDMLYCSKTREPAFEDVKPAAVAREVYELFHERVAREDIDFRIEVSDEEYAGSFDPDSLHSLMTNLVTNAIDACKFDLTEGKGRHSITLRCVRGPDGETLIEVSDTGPGIPKEAQDKIFEDFFSTKGSEGTGLGLLVAQKVAEEHGGKITFETEAGKGTTFRALLPR